MPWRRRRMVVSLGPGAKASPASASRCTSRTWRAPGTRPGSAMVDVAFAVPGDLAAPTGGYAYARQLLALLPEQGVSVRHVPLPDSYPHPSDADLIETERLLRETPEGGVLLVDGLAFGAMPASLVRGLGRRIVALVHHPLGFETGHEEAQRGELMESER